MKSTRGKVKKQTDASRDGLLTLDFDTGAITEVNTLLIRTLGYSRKELLGMKLWEIGAFEDAKLSQESFEAWQRQESIHYQELPLRGKDGHFFHAEFIISVPTVGSDKVIQCTIRHLARRHRAPEARRGSERQMQALMASLEDVIIEMDGQGTYLNIWTGNAGLLVRPMAEMHGRRVSEILDEPLASRILESCQHVLTRGDYEDIEYPLKVVSGRRWFLARINPVPAENGNAETVCMLIRDITKRKQMEDDLFRSEEALREQSVRDHLTGLFNRRYMEETLERELRRASRKLTSVGIIILDVDGFKRFNDTSGHAAGDEVLRELSNMLLAHVRGEDIPTRFGGDEFIIVLPDASRDQTRQRAELLFQDASRLNIQFEGRSLETLSLSAGVAAFPENGSTAEEVLKAADMALYLAKDQGQGRVVVAE